MPAQDSLPLLERELLSLDRRGPGAALPRTREVIRESWARSAAHGLRVDRLDVPVGEDVDTESPLMRCAAPVLGRLWSSVAGEPISIMLCDSRGLVLSRICDDRVILASLDAVALAPGSNYSESAVGTNGFGLALAVDRVALVAGDEHYTSQLSGYTCAGAPIHDPDTGALLGALSLTTWSGERNGLLAALAGQTALTIESHWAIESRWAARSPALPPAAGSGPATGGRGRAHLTHFEEIERDAIVRALELHAGVVVDAADDLGISRATIYRRIRRYGIRSTTHPHTGRGT